ncbi:MAG: sulfite exporter TauE/SafE family protein [Oceanospirillaceae bacterium]|nr:sulfite exporter TauE/SafE family protein [Oceanospirillaceae bacterium]
MITDVNFYLLAITALLIVGISKGGFGGGLGMIAVPMLSLVISPIAAAAILLPVLCLMDLFALRGFKGKFDFSVLKPILPAALVGVIVGALSFHLMSERSIKFMISVLTILFCLDAVVKVILKRKPEPKAPNNMRAAIWSSLSGFTSFSVHAGGPALNMYLLPLRLNKSVYASTTVVFFTFINYVKLIPYISLGLFDSQILTTALVLAPIAPLGIWLGIYLHNRLDEKIFYQLCYGFLFITGLKLGYDALTMA